MRIALDYDDTFTADPELCKQFVRSAKLRGHEVAFVTYRHAGPQNTDIMADAGKLEIPIIFCGHRQKSQCYEADIWIDDTTLMIPSYEAMHGVLIGHGLEQMR